MLVISAQASSPSVIFLRRRKTTNQSLSSLLDIMQLNYMIFVLSAKCLLGFGRLPRGLVSYCVQRWTSFLTGLGGHGKHCTPWIEMNKNWQNDHCGWSCLLGRSIWSPSDKRRLGASCAEWSWAILHATFQWTRQTLLKQNKALGAWTVTRTSLLL